MISERIRRKLAHVLLERAQRLRVFWYATLSTNSPTGSPTRRQPLQTVGLGRICFGERVIVGFFPSPGFMNTYSYIDARNIASVISIGSGTCINNNFSAIAEHSSISIGSNCFIGPSVEIMDSDFHGMKIGERRISRPEWCKPVKLGDDVFVGANVKILKGVTIGDGSVIANGSLVTHDIPAGVIAAGCPAKVIRDIG